MSDLIPDNECLRIGTTRARNTTCVWSGNTIERGTKAVALRRDHPRHTNAVVWCSVGSVERLAEALEQFNETAVSGERTTLSPTEDVGYYTPTSDRYHCMVCGESIESGEGVVFFSRGRRRNTCRVRCHPACTDRLVYGLNNVWEYTEALLPSQL